jgi:hypothetical protein
MSARNTITVHYKDGTEQDYSIAGRLWSYGEFYCFRIADDLTPSGDQRVTYLSGNVIDRISTTDRPTRLPA